MHNQITAEYKSFIQDIKTRIASSRYQAALFVNKELVLLYFHIGRKIIESQKSQGWGTKVIDRLSKDLKAAFPDMKGFSSRNLKYMRLFAETYPDVTFVQEVPAQLSWYHNTTILDKLKDSEERAFYISETIKNGWSRNVMLSKIEKELYKRQGKAVTNFNTKLPSPQSDLANNTLKDPYIFDFLTVHDQSIEREMERCLIKHMERFLLELGEGFAFVGRQYKLEVSNKAFYIDLLFYHLKLRCYVVIELKTKEFKPEHAGQLNFYLSAVDDLVKHEFDQPTIGLIICKTKDNVVAEYALRNVNSPIGVAEYKLTEALPEDLKSSLPSIEELEMEFSNRKDKLNGKKK